MNESDKHEGKPKAHDGEEHNAGERAEDPPVPEIAPKPLGPSGTVPLPKMPGRRQPPTNIKVKVTEAECSGAGQLDEEAEILLVVRANYSHSTTKPKFDGERRVISRDYVQTVKPTWTEDFDAFLSANGLKLVRVEEEGDAVAPNDLVNIEELRSGKVMEDAITG